jgi:hypothetical protein
MAAILARCKMHLGTAGLPRADINHVSTLQQ